MRSGLNPESNLSKGAMFSPCRTYRYALWRMWDSAKGFCMFICLNPSTADETVDDPTVRRCTGYAEAWGYGGMYMTNLFAFRATDPHEMKRAIDPVGPQNDFHLVSTAKEAAVVIAAWGTAGSFLSRDVDICKLIWPMECLRMTKTGYPAHPLYLPKGLTPVPFRRSE